MQVHSNQFPGGADLAVLWSTFEGTVTTEVKVMGLFIEEGESTELF